MIASGRIGTRPGLAAAALMLLLLLRATREDCIAFMCVIGNRERGKRSRRQEKAGAESGGQESKAKKKKQKSESEGWSAWPKKNGKWKPPHWRALLSLSSLLFTRIAVSFRRRRLYPLFANSNQMRKKAKKSSLRGGASSSKSTSHFRYFFLLFLFSVRRF